MVLGTQTLQRLDIQISQLLQARRFKVSPILKHSGDITRLLGCGIYLSSPLPQERGQGLHILRSTI